VSNKGHYWFADEGKVVVNRLMERRGKYSIWTANPVMSAWARNLYAYYSTVLDTTAWETSLQFAGEQGELVRMAVPQARSLIRQLVTLVTKQRLSFNCIAETQGSDVVADVRLGNAIADQIVQDEHLDIKVDTLVEKALVFGAGFMHVGWKTDKGQPYIPGDNGAIIYDGGLDIQVINPIDVYYQYNLPTWDQQPWAEVRVIKNRWDLVAQYPDLADKIIAIPSIHRWRAVTTYEATEVMDDDLIYVYEAYHKPTPAMPMGRMIMFSDLNTIFHDGDNDYGCIPIIPMIPEPIEMMCLGYPFLSNLLPCQEMLDHGFSAIATNQSAFAVQNIAVPRGSAVSHQEINGMNFISYTPQNVPGGGKPEALQLSQTAPETFKFIDLLYSHMQQISNVSPALRGNLPPGVTSGAAIATLTANAFEFINNTQKAFNLCIEQVMEKSILFHKKFAVIPRMVNIQGKNNQSTQKPYTGQDLTSLKGAKLVQVNPVMQTISGRLDLAQNLTQNGLITTPKDYISILEGAPLKQIYETELSENDLVQSENEMMMEGQQVMALATDDHALHIRKHKTLLNDPQVRLNNNKVGLILNHMQEHIQLAQTTDPMLLAMAMTGQMPQGAPPPQQGGGPAPDMGAPAMPDSTPAQPAPDELGRQ
jgi:hypothetical protein